MEEKREPARDIITKIVVTSSDTVLPMDLALQAHLLDEDVVVKETCFGLIVSGRREQVERMITRIRRLDPNGIFVKERGFEPADERRCRASRGGGPRPGFYLLKEEGALLPKVRGSLQRLERHAIVPAKKERKGRVEPEDIMKAAQKYS
ncbi:MAG: methanogenesis marker 6 protein [Methermicoccaceae archaeon]